MNKEYSFNIKIPSECLTKVRSDTGVDFQDTMRINITYTETGYYISEVDAGFLVQNKSLDLQDNRIHEGSLDIYPNEEI